jgi:UDP-N-acetylmuramoyl-L-alanyl-D-glutamate--2,6-diaminopimelate ligase
MMALAETTKGVLLESLLAGLADTSKFGRIQISGLSMDSRAAKSGDLFLACRGMKTSGVNYVREAIQAGVSAIAAEADAGLETFIINDVPVIPINDLRNQAGVIAARYHGHPSRELNVVGITGTNGKTSVSWFIAQALMGVSNRGVGVIGTLGYGIYPQLNAGMNTTPDPLIVQSTLADFQSRGVGTVVMEVTSIGLDQGRTRGVDFAIGILTNLTVDHLDYHGDMDTYAVAKKKLFTNHRIRNAVVNIDDTYGARLREDIGRNIPVTGYGLIDQRSALKAHDQTTDVAAIVADNPPGQTLYIKSPWGEGLLNTSIGGRYNAYNLLASLITLCLLDITFQQALESLGRVSPVPGRMEKYGGGTKPLVYVDYAHTPDALRNVLAFLRENHRTGKLVCVFGCGGGRDRSKRPQMGAIAELIADEVILTSDNPRYEDPVAIIQDILTGCSRPTSVRIELNRPLAVTAAIHSASAGDIVLIAGKGHETYQEIAGQRVPYSDRQLVRELLGINS